MASTLLSGIGVTALSGSIGDTTFTFNEYGAYAKAKAGAPASTAFLADWQAVVASITDLWENTMTDSDRLPWYRVKLLQKNPLAQRRTITGFKAFMRVNLNRAVIGAMAIIIPPAFNAPLQPNGISPHILSTTSITIFIRVPGLSQVAIYATRPLPPGRMSHNQIWKFMSTGSLLAGTTSVNITTEYLTRFPLTPLNIGNKIFLRVQALDDVCGQRSVSKFGSGIIIL